MEGETCRIECLSTWELSIGLVRYTRRNTYLLFVHYITVSSFHVQTTTTMDRGDTTARCWETILVSWYSFYTGAFFLLLLLLCNHWIYLSGGNPQIFHIKIYLQVLNSNTAHVNIVVQSLLLLKKELSQVWWTSSSDVTWVRAGWSWWLQVWKTKRKKKKWKRAVQLDSCNHVISFRPSEQPNGKKRACQPPTCNSESETSGNSEGCDISHLAEWITDTITKPPALQSKENLYIPVCSGGGLVHRLCD